MGSDLAPQEAAFTPFPSLPLPCWVLTSSVFSTLDYGCPCRQFARSTPPPSLDCVDKWVENCGSVLSSFHQDCMNGAQRTRWLPGWLLCPAQIWLQKRALADLQDIRQSLQLRDLGVVRYRVKTCFLVFLFYLPFWPQIQTPDHSCFMLNT